MVEVSASSDLRSYYVDGRVKDMTEQMTERLSLALPPTLVRRVRIAAAIEGITISKYLRRLIEEDMRSLTVLETVDKARNQPTPDNAKEKE